VHFGERHFQLLPLCEYGFAPGKSPVEVQPEILDILLRKVYTVYMDWGRFSLRVVNVTWTDLHSLAFILHLLTIFVLRQGWFAVSVKQYRGQCPWLVLQYRLQILLW
jgi:hypothetical protein